VDQTRASMLAIGATSAVSVSLEPREARSCREA
jgi:hypothetical protein